MSDNGLILALAALLLLTGCFDTVKQEVKPEPKAWWEKYNLDCDTKGRAVQIQQCVKAYYAHNPKENPELEVEALERCRLSSSMMFCTWRQP